MTFLLGALMGVAIAQDATLSAPVSAEVRATRLDLLLPALSKEWKIPLRCEPALENTPLILRVDRALLQEAMDKIAEATVGKWVKMPQGWELRRDTDKEADMAAQALARRAKLLDDAIARRLSELDRDGREESIRSTMRQALELEHRSRELEPGERQPQRTPLLRLGFRLLASIGGETLASLPAETRTVFASNPTVPQLPLGEGWEAVWTQFVEDCRNWNSIAADFQEQRPPQTDGFGLLDKLDPELVGKVWLQKSPHSTHYELALYDENGAKWRWAVLSLGPGVDPPSRQEIIEHDGQPPIELDPVSQWVVQMRQAKATLSPVTEASPAVLVALRSPVTHDPLSFLPSAMILEIARRKGQNVAAVVPDTLAYLMWVATAYGALGAKTFQNYLEAFASIEQREEHGWWVLSPDDPAKAHAIRMNRHELQSAIRRTDELGWLPLRDRARLAKPVRDFWAVVFSALIAADGQVWQSILGPEQLRDVVGSFTDDQWAALMRGEGLGFEQLNGDTLNSISELVYMASNLGATHEDGEPTYYSSEAPYKLGDDSTELLPNGFPDGAYVRLRVEESLSMFPLYGPWARNRTSPEAVAGAMYLRDHPIDGRPPRFTPTEFRISNGRKFIIDFQLAPNLKMTHVAEEMRPPSRRIYTLAELPEFQKQVQAEYERIKRESDGGS